jgi:hypothetical protein
LNRLTFFSKHRERILKKFNGTHINHDAKIAFLDMHSMKLGNNIFYDLESKRQDYIASFEYIPVATVGLGLIFFCGFAVKVPLSSKMYKETGLSFLMGLMISCGYVHKQKLKYLECVDETYDKLKTHFDKHPQLANSKDNDNSVIKNFGFHKFSDNDDEDDEGPDGESDQFRELGIFEGDPNKEKDEYKERILSHLYG